MLEIMMSLNDGETYSRHPMLSIEEADKWASDKWNELAANTCGECGHEHKSCHCENKKRKCNDCDEMTTNNWTCDKCDLLRRAFESFWNVIAAGHPEIKGGDGDFTDFEDLGRLSVKKWVQWNTPDNDKE